MPFNGQVFVHFKTENLNCPKKCFWSTSQVLSSKSKFIFFHREYRPEYERKRKEKLEEAENEKQSQLEKLAKDMKESEVAFTAKAEGKTIHEYNSLRLSTCC